MYHDGSWQLTDDSCLGLDTIIHLWEDAKKAGTARCLQIVAHSCFSGRVHLAAKLSPLDVFVTKQRQTNLATALPSIGFADRSYIIECLKDLKKMMLSGRWQTMRGTCKSKGKIHATGHPHHRSSGLVLAGRKRAFPCP